MSEQVTPHRSARSFVARFKWSVAIVVVLIAGVVAYWYRPLNATERMLVGGWEQVRSSEMVADHIYDTEKITMWFGPDRTFSVAIPLERRLPTGAHAVEQAVIQQGRWEASSTSLARTFDVPGASPLASYRQRPILFFYHLIGRAQNRLPVRFEGPDRVWMNDVEYRRVEEPIKN